MRRRTRIVSSATAAGVVLVGAGATIAAIPVHHSAPTLGAAVGQTMPIRSSLDAALATIGARSQASQRRITELDRDIARANAKIRVEAARRAAVLRLQQQRQAYADSSIGLVGSGRAGIAAAVTVAWATPPVVHTTTRASGSAGSSAPDGPSENRPGSGDGSSND